MSDFPVIHTERLTLRKPTYDYIGPLLELCQDDEVMLYSGMEPFKEEKQSREEIDWFLKIWKEKTGTRWVITLKGEDDFIGESFIMLGITWSKPLYNLVNKPTHEYLQCQGGFPGSRNAGVPQLGGHGSPVVTRQGGGC